MDARQKYRESLSYLHETILSSDLKEDGKTGTALRNLLPDIHAVLDEPGETPFLHHRNLLEKLEDLLGKLEVDHPKITGAISAAITSLNSVGI